MVRQIGTKLSTHNVFLPQRSRTPEPTENTGSSVEVPYYLDPSYQGSNEPISFDCPEDDPNYTNWEAGYDHAKQTLIGDRKWPDMLTGREAITVGEGTLFSEMLLDVTKDYEGVAHSGQFLERLKATGDAYVQKIASLSEFEFEKPSLLSVDPISADSYFKVLDEALKLETKLFEEAGSPSGKPRENRMKHMGIAHYIMETRKAAEGRQEEDAIEEMQDGFARVALTLEAPATSLGQSHED